MAPSHRAVEPALSARRTALQRPMAAATSTVAPPASAPPAMLPGLRPLRARKRATAPTAPPRRPNVQPRVFAAAGVVVVVVSGPAAASGVPGVAGECSVDMEDLLDGGAEVARDGDRQG